MSARAEGSYIAIVVQLLVWAAIWYIGLVVFDFWLELKGPWLMTGGAVTFFVCESFQNWVRSDVGPTGN